MTEPGFPDALPVGYRLHWYSLESVLGQGGFGITYLARDTNLDRPVAIKEYLPAEIARRRSDATAHPRTEASAQRYTWGLERFLLEARTLARFDHPNIVRVHSVFEANNTAYMVMRFEEGEDLADRLDREGTLPEDVLKDLLVRILDGLSLVHSAGFIHRDIKPENIYVRRDGSPVLLDFGSARQSLGSTKTMTILVAPGYAPLEQYYGDASTQGPWTDIYGLGATCYRAIAGRAPLDAVARAKGVLGSTREVLPSAAEVGRGRYGEPFLAAIDHSLKLSERDRPQTVDDWRRELTRSTLPEPVAAARPAEPAPVPVEARNDGSSRRRSAWLWGGAVAAGVVAAGAVFLATGAPKPSEVARSGAGPSARDVAPPPAPAAPEPVRTVAAPAPPPAVPAPPEAVQPVAVVEPSVRPVPAEREKPARPAPPAPAAKVAAAVPAPRPAPVKVPEPAPPPLAATAAPPPAVEPAPPPPPAPAPAVVAVAAAAVPAERPAPRSARDEQLDAGEAALRRGDHATAFDLLAPWAAAGVPRAQALLGRVQEGRKGRQRSDFEAYVWYDLAARGGDANAAALRDKVAARLQAAEIQQAERAVDHWRPRAEPAASASR